MDTKSPRSGPGAPYHDELLTTLSGWLASSEGITQGRMFGVPAWFVSGRVFACVWGSGVALRLPTAQAQSMVGSEGFEPFRPFGRAPMAGWLLRAPVAPCDDALTEALVLGACAHVRVLG